MNLPHSILGKKTVETLEARQSAPVLTIGSDTFTRPQLSKIGCFNFAAAARLTHVLTAELKVKDTKDLFQNYPPQHLAVPGLGSICLATLGAAFESKGLGNLSQYISRHTEKGHTVVTFVTMKHHVLDLEAATKERRDAKKRKARRQDKAHEIRVERHVTRQGNGNGGNGKTTNS